MYSCQILLFFVDSRRSLVAHQESAQVIGACWVSLRWCIDHLHWAVHVQRTGSLPLLVPFRVSEDSSLQRTKLTRSMSNTLCTVRSCLMMYALRLCVIQVSKTPHSHMQHRQARRLMSRTQARPYTHARNTHSVRTQKTYTHIYTNGNKGRRDKFGILRNNVLRKTHLRTNVQSATHTRSFTLCNRSA